MASSEAFSLDMDSLDEIPEDTTTEVLIGLPKPTTIDLIGGILCHFCNTTFLKKKEFDRHYQSFHCEYTTDTVIYTCIACHKQFTTYPAFRGHCYVTHIVRNKFKCEYCEKLFSKASSLRTHIDTMHKFKCNTCNKEFPSKRELHIHDIIHKTENDKPPYPCKTCEEPIDNSDACELHVENHCKIQYSCPMCDDVQTDRDKAAKHLRKHFDDDGTSNKPLDADSDNDQNNQIHSAISILGGILCSFCDTLFKNKTEFDLHFSEEHKNETILYTCNICDKQSVKYNAFANHCYSHYIKDKFQCEQCQKTFPRLSLLVIHTEAFHSEGATAKPFQCTTCAHAFRSRSRLMEHMRIAHEILNIKCSFNGCNESFTAPRDLILHQKSHSFLLGRWCRTCGLQFAALAAAERHVDVHARRSYSCPVCAKDYTAKCDLLKHVCKHFEAVLHICKVCSKSFSCRSRLVQHAKTHSAERAHVCPHCAKGFMRAAALLAHVNVHTGSRPYRCLHCPKTFTNSPNVAKHMRRMHACAPAKPKKPKAPPKKPKAAPPKKPKQSKRSANSANKLELVPLTESDVDVKSELVSQNSGTSEGSWTPEASEDPPQTGAWAQLEPLPAMGPEQVAHDFVETHLPFGHEMSHVSLEVPAGGEPPEYGPEYVDLDEPMPHIDPLLTIFKEEALAAPRAAPAAPRASPACPPPAWSPPPWQAPAWSPPPWHAPAWEPPVIAKIWNYGELAEYLQYQ